MLEPAWIGKIEPVSRSTVRVALNTGEILTSDWSNCGHPQKNPQAAIAEDLLKHPGSSCSSSRVHLARPAFPGRLPSWCSCAGRTSSPLPSRAAGFSLRRTASGRTPRRFLARRLRLHHAPSSSDQTAGIRAAGDRKGAEIANYVFAYIVLSLTPSARAIARSLIPSSPPSAMTASTGTLALRTSGGAFVYEG